MGENTCRANGGTELTIYGSGFSRLYSSKPVWQSQGRSWISGCTVKTITSTKLICLVDAGFITQGTVKVEYYGMTDTSDPLNVLSNPATIDDINSSTVNPGVITDITISDINFDSDATNTKVYIGSGSSAGNVLQIECKGLATSTG